MKDVERHAHLADVVQRRGDLQLVGGHAVQPQLGAHPAGELRHVVRVAARVRVAAAHGVEQQPHLGVRVRVRQLAPAPVLEGEAREARDLRQQLELPPRDARRRLERAHRERAAHRSVPGDRRGRGDARAKLAPDLARAREAAARKRHRLALGQRDDRQLVPLGQVLPERLDPEAVLRHHGQLRPRALVPQHETGLFRAEQRGGLEREPIERERPVGKLDPRAGDVAGAGEAPIAGLGAAVGRGRLPAGPADAARSPPDPRSWPRAAWAAPGDRR